MDVERSRSIDSRLKWRRPMSTRMLERPAMAKRSNDVSAKIDAEALRLARLAAEIAGTSVAAYISVVVAERATKDIDAWASARVDQTRKPKGK